MQLAGKIVSCRRKSTHGPGAANLPGAAAKTFLTRDHRHARRGQHADAGMVGLRDLAGGMPAFAHGHGHVRLT